MGPVVCPALVKVGRRNETGGNCIDAEHLLSVTLGAALHRVTGPVPPAAGRGGLLSCAPGQRHTLAVDALHAALTERAVPVRTLGADLPSRALRDAVRRTRPAAVALWAQTERTVRVGQLAQLHSLGFRSRRCRGTGVGSTAATTRCHHCRHPHRRDTRVAHARRTSWQWPGPGMCWRLIRSSMHTPGAKKNRIHRRLCVTSSTSACRWPDIFGRSSAAAVTCPASCDFP